MKRMSGLIEARFQTPSLQIPGLIISTAAREKREPARKSDSTFASVRVFRRLDVERRVNQEIRAVLPGNLAEPRSIFLKVCVAPSGPAFRVEQERPCETIAIKLMQRVCINRRNYRLYKDFRNAIGNGDVNTRTSAHHARGRRPRTFDRRDSSNLITVRRPRGGDALPAAASQ